MFCYSKLSFVSAAAGLKLITKHFESSDSFTLTNRVIFFSNLSSARKMTNWKEAKEKFISMPIEEKRKYYKHKDYKTLNDVATWKEYAQSAKLAPKNKNTPVFSVDSAKNATLVDKISIFLGDITTLEIDCIVNAANSSLLGGGGVDGAIHSAAGSELKEECKTLNGCETGEVKVSGGYKLPAKYVIHTVGPRGEKPNFLQSCYKKALAEMHSRKFRTIAIPCISTGIYGYPIEPASIIAVSETRKFLEKYDDDVDRVIFCLFSDEDKTVYEGLLQCYFPLE